MRQVEPSFLNFGTKFFGGIKEGRIARSTDLAPGQMLITDYEEATRPALHGSDGRRRKNREGTNAI
jgi:hypothetical protein